MKSRPAIVKMWIGFLVLAGLIAQANVHKIKAQESAKDYPEPLDIAQKTVSYPHPVRYLALQIEGQPVGMAYMDLPPACEPNGQTVLLLHSKNFYGDS